MRSEIPQLEVITAISDAECEDFVSQLLFSQGWNIIYRAIDFDSLTQALVTRSDSLRTVVIYKSDLPGSDSNGFEVLMKSTVTLICLDEVEINSHKVMTYIRSQLRLPLLQTPAINRSIDRAPAEIVLEKAERKVITVTGTTGAPGRTHLAYNLANYLSWQRGVQLIDADFRSPSLAYVSGAAQNLGSRCQLVTLDSQTKPTTLPIQESSAKSVAVIDLGALLPLEEVLNDRRWHATLMHHILELSTSLIYVTKSSGIGLVRLERFIADFPILLRKIPIVYVLNQQTSTREDRAIEARFLSLTAGEERFVLPKEIHHLAPIAQKHRSKRFEINTGTSRLSKQMGKIAELVT
ncbi:MAG: hypothetical protein WCK62_00175 [Actinomycetes bacterium]